MITDYKIVSASSPEELSNRVKSYIDNGWQPIGSHCVAEIHKQNRFRGTEHIDTIIKLEYSQTIFLEKKSIYLEK